MKVPRIQTLAEIMATLAELASRYERTDRELWPAAEQAATDRLRRFLQPDEATKLVKIVRLDRVRCDRETCGAIVPTDIAVGDLCQWCASDARRTEEGKP